jgi:hypothetical protein
LISSAIFCSCAGLAQAWRKHTATALNGRAASAALSACNADASSSAIATEPSESMRSPISITSRRSTTATGFW